MSTPSTLRYFYCLESTEKQELLVANRCILNKSNQLVVFDKLKEVSSPFSTDIV